MITTRPFITLLLLLLLLLWRRGDYRPHWALAVTTLMEHLVHPPLDPGPSRRELEPRRPPRFRRPLPRGHWTRSERAWRAGKRWIGGRRREVHWLPGTPDPVVKRPCGCDQERLTALLCGQCGDWIHPACCGGSSGGGGGGGLLCNFCAYDARLRADDSPDA